MPNLLYLFIVASFLGCNNYDSKNPEFYESSENVFKYSGRYQEMDEGVELINSAASVKTQVYGDSCVIYLESDSNQHHYVSLELNEQYLGRFRMEKSDSLTIELPKQNEGHLLALYKDTEASNGSIIFKGITAKKLTSIPQHERPKIEFIGNSITCGSGADTREIACDEGEWYDQHNAYMAYGPRVARALNAEFELSCVSGMGMYRNWNDEDQPVMPEVYSNLYLNDEQEQKADFSKDAPDVVSIALGTNDLSYGDGEKERKDFDSEKFTENYISFVETVFSYYPETSIALLSSPMLGEKENKILTTCLEKVKDHFSDKKISIFEFHKMEAGGCTSHPDIEDHEEIAQALIPYFKNLLNK